MLVKELDTGFAPPVRAARDNMVWINARTAPFKIYGVFYSKEKGRFLRMDPAVAARFDDVFENLNANTSGGRLRFCTDSPYIAIYAKQSNTLQLNMMTLCGQSGFDLYAAGRHVKTYLPKTNVREGFSGVYDGGGEMREYTLNFPLLDNVQELYIGLSSKAELRAAAPYRNEGRPIVFYGSSITQGISASRPGNCYTAALCRRLSVDYVNLGFASKCKGEPEMAEYIAKLPMSVFVLDFDHNVNDAAELKAKHYAFYKTVRDRNPDLPIVIASAPEASIQKPGYAERRLVVLDTYNKAKAAGERVFFADGALFFGDDPYDCTVDYVHPNDLGFYRMTNAFEKVFSENGLLCK